MDTERGVTASIMWKFCKALQESRSPLQTIWLTKYSIYRRFVTGRFSRMLRCAALFRLDFAAGDRVGTSQKLLVKIAFVFRTFISMIRKLVSVFHPTCCV